MKRPHYRWSVLCTLLFLAEATQAFAADPTPAAITAFNLYAQSIETRLAAQHRSANTFLTPNTPEATTRLQNGEILTDRIPAPAIPGALLHHWRGTAFIPNATAADFQRLLRDLNHYPQTFAPQITEAHILHQSAAFLQASLRIRQHHVITVLMDTTYDITFGQLDLHHGYSLSRSTHIDELDARTSLPVNPTETHGFLYRLNTYWSFAERDNGLYLQVESLSLTRAIPTGLAWAIRPYIESIPREALDFTLRSAATALQHNPTP